MTAVHGLLDICLSATGVPVYEDDSPLTLLFVGQPTHTDGFPSLALQFSRPVDGSSGLRFAFVGANAILTVAIDTERECEDGRLHRASFRHNSSIRVPDDRYRTTTNQAILKRASPAMCAHLSLTPGRHSLPQKLRSTRTAVRYP